MLNTRWLKIDSEKPELKKIETVVRVLEKGGVVAFPTETVYGLAALAGNKKAVNRIYRLKQRPISKGLTLQVASVKKAIGLIPEIPDSAKILFRKFSPGPVTLIVKKKRGTVGIRIPRHKISLAILKKINRPLAVTSANLSGGEDLNNTAEIKKLFSGRIDLIVDGGKPLVGEPSTVVDLTKDKWRILRRGKIKEKEIKKAFEQEN